MDWAGGGGEVSGRQAGKWVGGRAGAGEEDRAGPARGDEAAAVTSRNGWAHVKGREGDEEITGSILVIKS